MILHLTLGSTHIPIEINLEGSEPHLSVLQGQAATLPSILMPRTRRRVIRPILTLAAVAIVGGLTVYNVSPGRRDARLAGSAPAHAEATRNGTGRPAPVQADQIPSEIRRELAGRPIVTQPAPLASGEVGAKPSGGNPFGLE